jgi:radical SAM superfamily enzyme YgiQ (UPF0313 family)
MANGSFVFGMDDDDPSVFDRTVDWAIEHGIETATFHILTPYPGTALHDRMRRDGRILHDDWDRYDTRHAVFTPARMSPAELEAGYWRAYRSFYRWRAIVKGARAHAAWPDRIRHFAYAAGWKKCEPFWDLVIRAKRVSALLPVLERVFATTHPVLDADQPTRAHHQPERKDSYHDLAERADRERPESERAKLA